MCPFTFVEMPTQSSSSFLRPIAKFCFISV